jgi:hypothetical protein
MAQPARAKWWDDVVSVDSIKLNDFTYLLWGDRVRRLGQPSGGKVRVSARGSEGEIPTDALGGEPLLELYFVDVGQGDGVLVVTPEGHHLMIDGGLPRTRQQTGKSAADFVDWKFHDDYLSDDERDDPASNRIQLDALIASHPDLDHYGGLQDLIDAEAEAKWDELDTEGVTVEDFYHPGLCPQTTGTDELGPKTDGHFTKLLDGRDSLLAGLSDDPGEAPAIRGLYKSFLEKVRETKRKSGAPTGVVRLSQETGFLPDFGPGDDTKVAIRVLAPIEKEIGGKPALRDLGDEGVNKNGHSVALRLDYGDRRFLLTGDLNDQSQEDILAHYGDAFASTWQVDVAKACHHGSHHVHVDFLRGVNALSTVISSGDANTYDHPRAWVLGGVAVTGRVIDGPKGRLKAPLVYSTEVARSIALKDLHQLQEYDERQEFGRPKKEPVQTVSGKKTIARWRLVLEGSDKTAYHFPPVWGAKAMHSLIYGLVNVRTDGKRLLFAVRNEGNASWSYETLEPDDIASAYRLERPKRDGDED